MAQKELLNIANQKTLEDRRAPIKEEGELVREYSAGMKRTSLPVGGGVMEREGQGSRGYQESAKEEEVTSRERRLRRRYKGTLCG